MHLHPEHNSVTLKDNWHAFAPGLKIKYALDAINAMIKQSYTLSQLDQRCIELNYAITERAGFDEADLFLGHEIGLICIYLLENELASFFETMPTLNDHAWYSGEECPDKLHELAIVFHFDCSGTLTRVTTYPIGYDSDIGKYDMTNSGMFIAPNMSLVGLARKNM